MMVAVDNKMGKDVCEIISLIPSTVISDAGCRDAINQGDFGQIVQYAFDVPV